MTEPGEPAVRRAPRDGLTAVAVGLVALAAYTTTLLGDVGFWDTAVFQGAAATLGLTHPTGYPTYLLLGWLWTRLLPMAEPAWALNLLTAMTAAGAVSLAFLLARRIGAGTIASIAGALTIALMLSTWRTASRADPHPLHVLLALAVILLLLAWDRRGDGRVLVVAAVVFGLAMGNHLLTSMLAPGIGVYVFTRWPRILRSPRTVAASVAALLAGLAVYAYVPLRAAADPAIHHDYRPTTVPLFVRYVLGQDFAGSMGFLAPDGIGRAIGEAGTVGAQLGASLSVPVALGLGVLALAGIYALLWRRRWRTAWLLLATAGLTLYARMTYANADLERYAMYPMAVLGALAALGATAAWEGLLAGARPVVSGPDPAAGHGPARGAGSPAWRGALAGGAPALLLAVPAYLFAANAPQISIASARCYLAELEADAEPGAVIVSWWSYATPIWYAQAVEGGRPDIDVELAGSGVADLVGRRAAEGRPIYLVQFEGELERVRAAGYPLVEERWCGVSAWRVQPAEAAAPRAAR